jgi:type III pantothenate kinase
LKLLAIDVGNSNVMLAIFDDAELLTSWRLNSYQDKTQDDWWITVRQLTADVEIRPADITGVVLASVVPPIGQAISQMVERYLSIDPLIVSSDLELGMNYKVPKPTTIGADRLCNAVACRFYYGSPGVVIDLGTATTFDVIDEDGDFIGGIIAPGIETGASNLISAAALLSTVDFKPPNQVIGKDTESNLQSGIILGAVDMIDGLLERIRKEGGWQDMQIVMTGGWSAKLVPLMHNPVVHDPDLTVQGMRLIFERCK